MHFIEQVKLKGNQDLKPKITHSQQGKAEETEKLMGKKKVHRIHIRLHACGSLPVSGHPLNSALGTEKACKKGTKRKKEFSIRGKVNGRNQFRGQRKHLYKRGQH